MGEADLVGRTRDYQASAGSEVAERFFEAAIEALRSIEVMPGIGTPTVGERVGVDGLRRIAVDGFPCGWYYLERADHLDVIRLLADRQDVEMLLDLNE